MRKLSYTIVSIALIISCNNNNTNRAISTPFVVASDTATIKYQCPMKCEGDTAYTKEGKCPVCEMDLVRL